MKYFGRVLDFPKDTGRDLNPFNLIMIAMSSPMATTLESIQGADTLDYICKYYGVFGRLQAKALHSH